MAFYNFFCHKPCKKICGTGKNLRFLKSRIRIRFLKFWFAGSGSGQKWTGSATLQVSTKVTYPSAGLLHLFYRNAKHRYVGTSTGTYSLLKPETLEYFRENFLNWYSVLICGTTLLLRPPNRRTVTNWGDPTFTRDSHFHRSSWNFSKFTPPARGYF